MATKHNSSTMPFILFVGHDPSAKNHTRPLFEYCLSQNYDTKFLDLSILTVDTYIPQVMANFQNNNSDNILVTGCSTNGWEYNIIAATKEENFIIKTIMIAELGFCNIDAIRIQGLTQQTTPNLILTTNEMARKTFKEKLKLLGVLPSNISVQLGGSVHMEALGETAKKSKPALNRQQVRNAYGLHDNNGDSTFCLVPYFTAPDDPKMKYSRLELINTVRAALSIVIDTSMLNAATSVVATKLPPILIVVRPHPRTSIEALEGMKTICTNANNSTNNRFIRILLDIKRFPLSHDDDDDNDDDDDGVAMIVDNSSLMLASDATLSYGSTTSLESIILGTPSAFVLCHEQWPYQHAFLNEQFSYCNQLPRVSNSDEFRQFLMQSIDPKQSAVDVCGDTDHSKNALTRNWYAIENVILQNTVSMIHNENINSVGENQSTDSVTATARNCLQNLPRHLRLQIFHILTYRNFLLLRPTCTVFKTDLAISVENNCVLRCLHVPEDYRTLNEAYKRIEQSRGAVTTIVLGQGEHVVEDDKDDCNYLHIKCPVNIVGSRGVLDKSNIVVVGGFRIGDYIKNIHGNVHVEHLTIRHEKQCGVFGYSSFTLNDLIIEQCGGGGVFAYGSSTHTKCSNITAHKCRSSGVVAGMGASIILEGRETSIYENCSDWSSNDYGLHVYGSSSKIQIVSPLTKESISKGNKGGGNWGATQGATMNQIEIIEE
jgi:hypothetical protein